MCKVTAANIHFTGHSKRYILLQSQTLPEIQPENQTVPLGIYPISIAPVAQLVRTSDWSSEGPGLNPSWTSYPFFPTFLFPWLLHFMSIPSPQH